MRLDDLVADTEIGPEALDFILEFARRIQRRLKLLIQSTRAELMTIHRCQHLDIRQRIKTVTRRKTTLHQVNNRPADFLGRRGFDEEEVAVTRHL